MTNRSLYIEGSKLVVFTTTGNKEELQGNLANVSESPRMLAISGNGGILYYSGTNGELYGLLGESKGHTSTPKAVWVSEQELIFADSLGNVYSATDKNLLLSIFTDEISGETDSQREPSSFSSDPILDVIDFAEWEQKKYFYFKLEPFHPSWSIKVLLDGQETYFDLVGDKIRVPIPLFSYLEELEFKIKLERFESNIVTCKAISYPFKTEFVETFEKEILN